MTNESKSSFFKTDSTIFVEQPQLYRTTSFISRHKGSNDKDETMAIRATLVFGFQDGNILGS